MSFPPKWGEPCAFPEDDGGTVVDVLDPPGDIVFADVGGSCGATAVHQAACSMPWRPLNLALDSIGKTTLGLTGASAEWGGVPAARCGPPFVFLFLFGHCTTSRWSDPIEGVTCNHLQSLVDKRLG
jgi:hypothetical protein